MWCSPDGASTATQPQERASLDRVLQTGVNIFGEDQGAYGGVRHRCERARAQGTSRYVRAALLGLDVSQPRRPPTLMSDSPFRCTGHKYRQHLGARRQKGGGTQRQCRWRPIDQGPGRHVPLLHLQPHYYYYYLLIVIIFNYVLRTLGKVRVRACVRVRVRVSNAAAQCIVRTEREAVRRRS